MGDKKFTSGEWLIEPTDGVFVYALNSSGANQFSLILSGNGNRGASAVELKANAHIIATATEMYFELQRDLTRLENSKGNFKVVPPEITREIKRKKKLLAKARGEQ